MSSIVLSFQAQRTLIAMAACAACLSVQAQSANVDASVSFGLSAADGSKGDRATFGQYNGLRTNNAVPLLGIDYSLRDQEAGKSVDLKGSDLFGDTRELNLVWKNPGQWKVTADYGELVRLDSNTVKSGTGVETDLKTRRSSLGIGLTKIISPALQLQVDLKSENKEGKRAFSLGYTCSALLGSVCNLMSPEPINANHSQVEARASYALDKFRFNVGYYGSFYRNSNTALSTSGLGTSSTLNQLSLALPPDNQAHQLDVSGSYDFTPTTRGNFKLAWSTASQNEDFSSTGLVGPQIGNPTLDAKGNPVWTSLSSAGAKIDTTLAKLGFTSKPLPQLSLLGDLRYENKDDQTPLYNYNTSLVSAIPVDTNRNLPNQNVQGKLQAGWQFNADTRGTLGADFESIDRGTYTASATAVGVDALRQKTDEAGIRAELSRKFADDLSGSVGLSSSHRDGSSWLQPNPGAAGVSPLATFASGTVFMPTLANRQRDKVKLTADWQASEKVNLQFRAENGTDKFSAPTANGLRGSDMNQFGVDWSYAVNDNWNVVGYLSQIKQTLNQSVYGGTVMAFENNNMGSSIGVTGKYSSKVNIGASLSYVDDRSAYAQSPDAAALPNVVNQLALSGGLPDINYRQTALKLFANYTLEKKSSVRVDLVHQRTSINDWTWGYNGVPFSYSDSATVSQNANQNVSYIGVTYVYQLP